MNLIKKISRNLLAAACIFTGAFQLSPASAQDYPKGPVTMLVPAPTGGASDILARVMAKSLEQDLGQPVPILNRGSGGGVEGMQEFTRKPPDGQTLILLARSHLTQIASGELPFSRDDFIPLGTIVSEPYALVTRSGDTDFDSLGKIFDYAKANHRKLIVGGYATKSASHLTAEQLFSTAGATMQWLPLAGGSQVIESVLGGHVKVVATQTGGILQFIESKKLSAVAVSSPERSSLLPEVPTFRELGYDVAQLHWRALFVKKGTDPKVVERLTASLHKLKDDPGFQDYLKKVQLDQDYMTPERVQEIVRKDHDDMRATMKALNLIQ